MLNYNQLICPEGKHPFDTVNWHRVDVKIVNQMTDKVVFEQADVEAPENWSQRAVEIMVSKYFRGHEPKREHSIKEVLWRVARQFWSWAANDEYLHDNGIGWPNWDDTDMDKWLDECAKHSIGVCGWVNDILYILLHQMAAFNSPVWFNMGTVERPQTSACFILGIEDSMESIVAGQGHEAMIYKRGSGAGANWSNLRANGEQLSPGGFASGPVSFMRGSDAWASVIKSGGATRRAAKISILDIDHPDIDDFIECKAREEERAHILIANGISAEFNEENNAYDSVPFQNSNHSVMIPDLFMERLADGGEWYTTYRTTGEIAKRYSAQDLWIRLWEAAWKCGDPGVQFYDTINRMNPLISIAPIRGSNPCGEYLGVPDTACNLASINLVGFMRIDAPSESYRFDTSLFQQVTRAMVIAMDLLVHRSSYPYEKMREQVPLYRALGLGYSNLGSLLMRLGYPYDSENARQWAASITGLMTATAAETSAELAEALEPFPAIDQGTVRESLEAVWLSHRDAFDKMSGWEVSDVAVKTWNRALAALKEHGARNAFLTLLAPTGTISFLMDCDTTGCEPEFQLVKYKKLVGGSTMQMSSDALYPSLVTLGYGEQGARDIVNYVNETGNIENAPHIGDNERHLAIFDCSNPPLNGERYISPQGHIHMLAAIQSHLSMGISKTVNLPSEVTVDDMADVGYLCWKLGVKDVALYRAGCKLSEPLSTSDTSEAVEVAPGPLPEWGHREQMPDHHKGEIHGFRIGGMTGHKFHFIMGHWDDDRLGEIFIKVSKEGSTLQGALDGTAMMISLALQHGASVESVIKLLQNTKWEPAGFTTDKYIKMTTSPLDFLAKYLELHYDKQGYYIGPPVDGLTVVEDGDDTGVVEHKTTEAPRDSGEVCDNCGTLMMRQGTCFLCPQCASTSGCGG